MPLSLSSFTPSPSPSARFLPHPLFPRPCFSSPIHSFVSSFNPTLLPFTATHHPIPIFPIPPVTFHTGTSSSTRAPQLPHPHLPHLPVTFHIRTSPSTPAPHLPHPRITFTLHLTFHTAPRLPHHTSPSTPHLTSPSTPHLNFQTRTSPSTQHFTFHTTPHLPHHTLPSTPAPLLPHPHLTFHTRTSPSTQHLTFHTAPHLPHHTPPSTPHLTFHAYPCHSLPPL